MEMKPQSFLRVSSILLFAFAQTYAFAPPHSSHRWARLIHKSPSNTPQHAVELYASVGLDDGYFEDLGLSDDLVTVTEKMEWSSPTAVQQLSIPSILELASSNGHDRNSLWCEAPTGSGKTGGFCLPLLQTILRQKRDMDQTDEGYVSTLILAPTRELAAQTANVIKTLVSHLPKRFRSSISVEIVHGGVPIQPQISALAKRRKTGSNLDFLVATPGRLVDIMKHGEDDPTMSALETRVLNAFAEKSQTSANKPRGKGKRGRSANASSLTLNDIQEMELDRMDDDGRSSLNELLQKLDFLIFDEADRLLGGAFLEEIEELMTLLPQKSEHNMKVCLFSATFPEETEKRVDAILSKLSTGIPVRMSTTSSMQQRVQLDDNSGELSHRKEKRLAHTTPISSVAKDFAPNIKHRAIRLDERDRTQVLRRLIEQNSQEWDRILVFVGTRYHSEHVTRKLRRYGIKAAELHGKLDQNARDRRLKSFRNGSTQVLLSTDLSARGIDVEGLPVVINYDLPRGIAEFTHRTGRTGRAGRAGTAVSFITASKEAHFDLIEKKELGGQVIEREVLEGFEPDEAEWQIQSKMEQTVDAHDRMFGGVKGRRKSKKDKMREAALKAQGM